LGFGQNPLHRSNAIPSLQFERKNVNMWRGL
jgi:hypothetical protein